MNSVKTFQTEMVKTLLAGETFEFPAEMVAIDEMADAIEATGLFSLNRYEEDGVSYVEALAVYETYIQCHEIDGVYSVEVARENLLDKQADHVSIVFKEYKTERGARKFAEAEAAARSIEWNGFFYGENEA